MLIDYSDIKKMIMESAKGVLMNEAINKDNLIYVVYPQTMVNNPANITHYEGKQKTASELIRGRFGINPVPPFVIDKIPNRKERGSYYCSIFTDSNIDDLFKGRYGNQNINKPERLEKLLALLETFVCGTGVKRHKAIENEDFFVIRVPVRELQNEKEFDYGEDTSNMAMNDKECFFLSKVITDSTSGEHYFGKVLARVLSKYQMPSNSFIGKWLLNINSKPVYKQMFINGKLPFDIMFKHVNTGKVFSKNPVNESNETVPLLPQHRELYYGETDSSTPSTTDNGNIDSIGIYWNIGRYSVVQFYDSDNALFAHILKAYNELGLKKIGGGNGLDSELEPSSARSVKGIDALFGLYSVNAGVGSYGEYGQTPDASDIDFAFFDNVQDLMSWYHQYATEMYSTALGKQLSGAKSDELRRRYGIAYKLRGESIPKGTVAKREASLEAFRKKFSPAVDEVLNPNTMIGGLAMDIEDEMSDIAEGLEAPARMADLMYPNGKLFKIAAYKCDFDSTLDNISADFEKRRDEFLDLYPNNTRADRVFYDGIAKGFLKKVVGAKINADIKAKFPEKDAGVEVKNDSDELQESRIMTMTMDDIKNMVLETASRILNESSMSEISNTTIKNAYNKANELGRRKQANAFHDEFIDRSRNQYGLDNFSDMNISTDRLTYNNGHKTVYILTNGTIYVDGIQGADYNLSDPGTRKFVMVNDKRKARTICKWVTENVDQNVLQANQQLTDWHYYCNL